MPSSVRKDESLSPYEQHQAAKEQMLETIIHHAEGVQEMVKWVDSVKGTMTREEISEKFSAHAQKALYGISEIFIEEVAEFLREKQNRGGWRRRRDILEQTPNFSFVYEILQWYLIMNQAWEEVSELRQNPSRIFEEANRALARQGYPLLEREDIIDEVIEPFCIHIIVIPEAFQRITPGENQDDRRDSLGFFLPGTHFSFVKMSYETHEEEETIRHESGHQLIDRAPSFGQGDVLSDIRRGFERVGRDRSVSSLSRKNAAWNRQRLWKQIRASAVDRLHNEFLAELNVVRHRISENIEERYWSTAESSADDFRGAVAREIAELRPIKPKFARKLATSTVDIYDRFQREKSAVTHALHLAPFLQDPDARLFIVALTFVMPIRSYHHIREVLEKKYSKETVEKAEKGMREEREYTFDL